MPVAPSHQAAPPPYVKSPERNPALSNCMLHPHWLLGIANTSLFSPTNQRLCRTAYCTVCCFLGQEHKRLHQRLEWPPSTVDEPSLLLAPTDRGESPTVWGPHHHHHRHTVVTCPTNPSFAQFYNNGFAQSPPISCTQHSLVKPPK